MTAVLGQRGRGAPWARGRFAPQHPWDRNFFAGYVALIWFIILMGFVPDVIQHVQKHKPPYPLMVHVHAAAMVGWLSLLTAQVLLVRAGRTDLHRRLGVAAIGLAVVLPFLGIATAIVVDRQSVGTPHADPAFFSVQLLDMIAFAGAVAAAIALRARPSAHKRLMLLAVLALVDAGFARWLGDTMTHWLGSGFWPFMAEIYPANIALILGIGIYDLVTRGRLLSAYVAGATWVVGCLGVAGWLYVTPAWAPIAAGLIGR